MTKRVGKTVLIEPELSSECELCGEVKELRPYGPGGKRICFQCAMKDPEGTKRRANAILFGAPEEDS